MATQKGKKGEIIRPEKYKSNTSGSGQATMLEETTTGGQNLCSSRILKTVNQTSD